MNIRFVIGFLSLMFVFASCNEKKQAPQDLPKVLIAEDKMAEIIAEVQLIEAYINQVPFNKREVNDSDYVYYPLLFEKYKISKTDFLENLVYYSQKEATINSIYDKAIVILNKIKAKDIEIRLEMKLDSIKKDSIRKEAEFLKIDSLRKKGKARNKNEEIDREDFDHVVDSTRKITQKIK